MGHSRASMAAMIRGLIALLTLLAVALNAPAAMAAAGFDQRAPVAEAAGAMHDCSKAMQGPAKQQCRNAACVVCHAIPLDPPSLSARTVAFVEMTPPAMLARTGLNPKPEPPPPRG